MKGSVFLSSLVRKSAAGTMESSDVFVEIEPADGLEIEIESVVQQQFGQAIEQAVRDVLRGQGVTGARVRLTDRGALECVIRARVETAVRRGKESA